MVKIKFPLIRPYSGRQEIKGVERVLKSGWLTQGSNAAALEEQIKKYIKVRYACLMNSATSGLIACVKALGLSGSDKVIVPAFTFPATANAVVLGGASPVFCDIEMDTFNICAEKIERSVSRRTKAIIVVHEFGLPADMEKILRVARKHGLFVIEDAACSLAAEYKARKAGGLADMGVFSFHPRKIVSCGEGGCVVTDSGRLARKIEILKNHGEYDKEFSGIGYNFRLSDIQAAILISQFRRIEKLVSRRMQLAKHYDNLLKPLNNQGILRTPFAPKDRRHTYQSYVILLSPVINRDKLIGLLRQKGIETQVGTYCVPMTAFYRNNFTIPQSSYDNASFAYRHTLTLPLYQALRHKDQEFIAKQLTESIKKCAQ
jgi:perosamine synthetase